MRRGARPVGWVMLAVGVLGIITGIVTMVVGIRMIGRTQDDLDASLAVTDQALETVSDSLSLSDQIVVSVRSGLDEFETTLGVLQGSFATGANVIEQSNQFIGGSLPDTLDAVIAVLPSIQNVASSVDNALRVLSRAPFGPDYNPAVPFDDSIAQLSTALSPMPAQLRGLVDGFDDLVTSANRIDAQLGALADNLDALDQQLGGVEDLVDRYSQSTAEAQSAVADARADLEKSSTGMRWLLVLLGIVLIFGQVVPLWLGTELVRRPGRVVLAPPTPINEPVGL